MKRQHGIDAISKLLSSEPESGSYSGQPAIAFLVTLDQPTRRALQLARRVGYMAGIVWAQERGYMLVLTPAN